MTNRPALIAMAVGLLVLAARETVAEDRFSLDLEAGPVWQLRNDFAVPGDTGTLVRLEDKGPSLAGRATLFWNVSDRWSLRFLAAPLSTQTDFVPAEDVHFEDVMFAAGTPVRVDYRFDSYRVGAFYRSVPHGPWSWRAGLTVKLRDAEIALHSDLQDASKSNTGVVPLLYGGLRWQIGEKIALDLDADAAAASQGRAEDVALRVETRITDKTSVYLGGRMLDGGADNEEVYSFGTFAYAFAGARFQW